MGRYEEDPPLASRGTVDAALLEEHPGLYIRWLEVDRGSGRAPRELKSRLAALSDRFAGPQAVTFRTKPIPSAYRVFYRHIGLDPDEQPTPPEQVVLERMLKGGFVSRNLLDDALTIAMIESGVPVLAFDADALEGELRIRPSEPGETLEGRPADLPAGTLRDRRRRPPAVAAVRRDGLRARREPVDRAHGPGGDRRRRGPGDRRRGSPLDRRGDPRGSVTDRGAPVAAS